MMPSRAVAYCVVAFCIVCLTLLNFFQFPGHTYLQSDTQIYAPILEHLWDPELLARDLIVQRPHVSLTLYDEAALGLRKVTGLGFEQVLEGQQFVFRALGIWGVYLLAASFGLSTAGALLVTAIVSLGATIVGPSVLTFEYEPVPRGFAVMLLCLAMGLAAQGRFGWASAAAAAATLYHAPTCVPFWIVFLTAAPAKRSLPALGAAALILWIGSMTQLGPRQPQIFFSRLDEELERLQRLRASYNWISVWGAATLPHYLVMWGAGLLAGRRLGWPHRWLTVGLPALSLATPPLSFVLLEGAKWALMAQVQPMRALLFVTLISVILAAAAGVRAAGAGRRAEALGWFCLAYLIPLNVKVTTLPDLSALAVMGALAGYAVVFASAEAGGKWWGTAGVAVTAVAAFFAVPILGGVRNYPPLHNPELNELAAWARASTPKNTMFLFPDAGQSLEPGVFRAYAVRALYVDWKGGGQANHFRDLAEEWWKRWHATVEPPFDPKRVPRYGALGIDYFVVKAAHRIPGGQPVYINARYAVYPAREP